MTVLYYTSKNSDISVRLLQVIEILATKEQTEIYQSVSSLSLRLREPSPYKEIAVLLADTRDDLLEILSIRDLLEGIRVIIVLPDREADTVSNAYTLFPRYLSYTDSDFNDVSAVLKKMLRRKVPENIHGSDTVTIKEDLILNN